MNTDLIRFIDSISRDKSIEKESVFADLEAAMISAARKAFDEAEEVTVRIDRLDGTIEASADGKPIDMTTLGRIAAQTAKQVLIQKVREDERNSIFEEYSQLVGTVVTGNVTRYEGGALTVNLGRTEAFLPRSEQIPGESHQPGERIRAMILDVREEQNQVRIVLTQTHPDYIRKLFELEVPEVGERIIEIRALAREAGYRTKIAVSSIDSKVDAVGACVGVRGSRIRNIVDELGGEKIDIVRWNESSQVLITNSLKPAEVREVFLCFELGKATVIVDEEQLSLAIGKRGQNVRLGARLTGWDIDISTPAAYDKNVDQMESTLKAIDGVEDLLLDKMLAMGIVSLGDLAEVGVDPLVSDLEMEEALATTIIESAATEAKRISAENAAAKKEAEAARKQAEQDAREGRETDPQPEEATSKTEGGDADATGADQTDPGVEAESVQVEDSDTPSPEGTSEAQAQAENSDEQPATVAEAEATDDAVGDEAVGDDADPAAESDGSEQQEKCDATDAVESSDLT